MGDPKRGVNIHALMLSDPSLSFIAANRNIGKIPSNVNIFILSPGTFRANKNKYNVAKR